MKRLVVSLVISSCASLPPAPEAVWSSPRAPEVPLQLCWIDTGGVTVAGGHGAGGSVQVDRWEVTATSLLVRHPQGDLLIDTGMSPSAAQEAEALSGWRRFVFDQTAGQNQPRRELAASLAALGVTQLKGIVLSHAHADHAGGLAAVPGVPVWVADEEATFITENTRQVVMPAHAKAAVDRLSRIPFVESPYALYSKHFDVFGDGTVVIVPTPGHTPGSVATFLNVSAAQRFLHVGDLINLRESIERKVGKSWLMRVLTDEDDAATASEVARLVKLHEADPALTILPAHDRPAYVRLFGEDAGEVPPCLPVAAE